MAKFLNKKIIDEQKYVYDIEIIDANFMSIEETKNSQTSSVYQYMSFYKYLSYLYGEHVDESIVRKCLELSYLASKYTETETEEQSAEELDAALNEYKASHDVTGDKDNPSIVTFSEDILNKVKPIEVNV